MEEWRKDGYTRCKQSRKILLKDWREGEKKGGGKLNRKTFSTSVPVTYFFSLLFLLFSQKFSILLIEPPNTIKRDRSCMLLSIFFLSTVSFNDISASRLEVFPLV